MRHVFRSLAHESERAYTFEHEYSEFWNQISRGGYRNYVHDRAGLFLTYGDRMVQHSAASAVPTSDMADYLGSLMVYVSENEPSVRRDIASKLRSSVAEQTSWKRTIPFLLSLKYDENKRKYYSLHGDSYLKVSSSDSKRHDKRWAEVPPEAGKVEFVWQTLIAEYHYGNALELYSLRKQFVELVREHDGWCPDSPSEFLGVSDQRHIAQIVNCVQAMVEGEMLLDYSEGNLDCYLRNAGLKQEAESVS